MRSDKRGSAASLKDRRSSATFAAIHRSPKASEASPQTDEACGNRGSDRRFMTSSGKPGSVGPRGSKAFNRQSAREDPCVPHGEAQESKEWPILPLDREVHRHGEPLLRLCG